MTGYQNTDFGAPGPVGEPGPGAPRRPRRTKPLSDTRVRTLVAGILEERVSELLSDASLSDQFIAAQLDDVINELRGVE